jgi:L-threonylcarbamoyladenylate synthase
METLVRRLNYENIDQSMIEEAGRIIRQGGLVAFPTETVYGLGGDALNPHSSEKIYAAKGRPSDNPLIVHIAKKEDVYRIAQEVSHKAEKLMEAFWPGPLTMIFQKKPIVPDKTTGGLDTVAVRLPSDRIAAAFIQAAGGFVAAPSANVSGRPSTTTAEHVVEDLSGRIEMILDGGQAVIGLESTIVDVSGETPVILRPGVITKAMMEQVIGPMETDQAIIDPNSGIRPKAPGMKYRHYAPRADLTIVEGETEAVIGEINRLTEEAMNHGKQVGIIATDETASRYPMGLVMSLGARSHEEEISMHLFEVLRKFDDTEVTCIFSESFEQADIGPAIMNRLLKAAGHKVIRV